MKERYADRIKKIEQELDNTPVEDVEQIILKTISNAGLKLEE